MEANSPLYAYCRHQLVLMFGTLRARGYNTGQLFQLYGEALEISEKNAAAIPAAAPAEYTTTAEMMAGVYGYLIAPDTPASARDPDDLGFYCRCAEMPTVPKAWAESEEVAESDMRIRVTGVLREMRKAGQPWPAPGDIPGRSGPGVGSDLSGLKAKLSPRR